MALSKTIDHGRIPLTIPPAWPGEGLRASAFPFFLLQDGWKEASPE